jgi:hypothetical protein
MNENVAPPEDIRRALAEAKARGIKLVGPNQPEAAKLGAAANKTKPTASLRTSYRSFARYRRAVSRHCAGLPEHSVRGVQSARGAPWSAEAVSIILKRTT